MYPQRPTQHVLDTKASKYLERHIPDEWIYESVKNDYGIDYSIGIVNSGDVLGPNFSIQLKGKENISKEKRATAQIKKTTLNYWNNRFEPTLVVIYCDKDKRAFYRWFDKSEFNLTSSQNKFSFNIDKSNSLDSIDWQHIKNEIIELFTLKHRLYHLYSLSLSKLKNEEFEHIWNTYTGGKFEDTIEYCKKKIEEELTVLWCAILGHAYYAVSQYKLALYYNQKGLSILPNEADESIKSKLNYNLKSNRASALAELGRVTDNKFYLFEAYDLWEELINEEHIEDFNLYYNFANTCVALSKLVTAKKYYQKSIKLEQNNAQAWANLGDTYGLMSDFKEELKCYQMAIRVDNTLKNALIGEAIAFYHLKKYKEALTKFVELKIYEKEWQTSFSNYYCYFSKVYKGLNQVEKSISIAEEGYFYDPGNVDLINMLSEIYSARWKYDNKIKEKAKKLYLKRLEVFTDDIKALGELVNMMVSENVPTPDIVFFIKNNIKLKEDVSDEELVELFVY